MTLDMCNNHISTTIKQQLGKYEPLVLSGFARRIRSAALFSPSVAVGIGLLPHEIQSFAPRKRTIAVQRCAAVAAAAGGAKKLRRLLHIFAKVLELPFAADADVAIEEDATALRFVAAADGFSHAGARAHAAEIHPGVTKIVVRDLSAGVGGDDGAAVFELDRWRFRLPPCTRPTMATATYLEGELVVTVPKGAGSDDSDGDEGAAVLGGAGGIRASTCLGRGKGCRFRPALDAVGDLHCRRADHGFTRYQQRECIGI